MSEFFYLYKFWKSFVYFDQTRGQIWSNFPNRIFFWMGISCKLIHFPKKWIFGTSYSASFNFQPYSRGWSLTSKKPFLSLIILGAPLPQQGWVRCLMVSLQKYTQNNVYGGSSDCVNYNYVISSITLLYAS